MTVVLEPTVDELEDERGRLLDGSPFSESELLQRAASYSLTPDEARLLRRLEEIRFLLGYSD